jgi:uncharacterized membrane protein YdfJ with MMPL/SSD domain
MINPFKHITNWKRKDFDELKPEDVANRKLAETETSHDLQKEIQQLLCDAHEEAQRQSIVGVNKRMVALLTVTAYDTRITNWWLKVLTIIIAIGTVVLVIRELFPIYASWEKCHADKTEQSCQ